MTHVVQVGGMIKTQERRPNGTSRRTPRTCGWSARAVRGCGWRCARRGASGRGGTHGRAHAHTARGRIRAPTSGRAARASARRMRAVRRGRAPTWRGRADKNGPVAPDEQAHLPRVAISRLLFQLKSPSHAFKTNLRSTCDRYVQSCETRMRAPNRYPPTPPQLLRTVHYTGSANGTVVLICLSPTWPDGVLGALRRGSAESPLQSQTVGARSPTRLAEQPAGSAGGTAKGSAEPPRGRGRSQRRHRSDPATAV